MSNTRYSDDQIAEILCSVDRMIDRNHSITDICRHHGISRSSLYRWQQRFGIQSDTGVNEPADIASLRQQLVRREQQVAALTVAAEGNSCALCEDVALSK